MLGTFRRPVPAVPPKGMAATAPQPKTHAEISHLYEVGLTSIAMSFHEAALETIQEVTQAAPDHAGALKALAYLLRMAGRDPEAAQADTRRAGIDIASTVWREAEGERSHTQLDRRDRKLKKQLEKIPDEKRMPYLRDLLFAHPLDVAAMRYLASEENFGDDEITALNLLDRALQLSPNYVAARVDYAELLADQRQHLAVLRHTDLLLTSDPQSLHFRQLRADAAMQMERFDEARVLYEGILAKEPRNVKTLTSYGGLLKTLGRREESVAAFRTVLSIKPDSGGAYFGLSELKAKYLTPADVADMQRHLAQGIAEIGSRKCMAYALGAALERSDNYEGSFKAYAFGAAACQEEVAGSAKAYDPEKFAERLARMRRSFTAENLAKTAAPPDEPMPATTPIFVLGMPRAGSTLVEQILASHSMVEGTRELPVVSQLVKKVGMSRLLVNNDVYPECVVELNRTQLGSLGEECLAGIAAYRKTTLPYVIDKRPWNWLDACFIKLMLPNARFIDIRRPPMAAGFAMFKQLLPDDAAFSFDLRHLGHYYRSYVAYMDHLDSVMPGSILRVSYPSLVDDTETQIRRMLAYCGLPFEEGCLRFWQTDRAVLTPSAEQVRRPIFRDALEQWKRYERWLGPLREALGDLAET